MRYKHENNIDIKKTTFVYLIFVRFEKSILLENRYLDEYKIKIVKHIKDNPCFVV